MNIQEITDITVLKSMAYDQLVLQQQTQRNLELLNLRIAELESIPHPPGSRRAAKSTGQNATLDTHDRAS